MLSEILASPALWLIGGGLLLPLVPARLRAAAVLLLPVLAAQRLVTLPLGTLHTYSALGHELVLTRVDGLSRIFAIVFLVAMVLNALYAWRVDDPMQQVAATVYPGAAIGAVLAGDLFTLFLFWELTGLVSTLLVLAGRTARARRAAGRYLVMQLLSGLLLLGGAAMFAQQGTLAFGAIGLDSPAGWLVFLAFGIKSAFPLLHTWVQDAYPESTVTGTVVLSIFTTKMAVYALARGFAGTEILMVIGAVMTMFPIFYAVIENDLRRVLTYSLNNQVGFMVVAIGIGTETAVSGAAMYAVCNILFEGLLFMSMGAVLLRTGTIKGSELGGLYKSMPATMLLCVIGAASISAFPLFSGFVSKPLIVDAAAGTGQWLLWATLVFASAGVFHHSGIKIPFFAFFAHDRGLRCKEAPPHMLLAMGLTAALCIGIGVYPQPLYDLLPYAVPNNAYTTPHVVAQLQLLFFSALAFATLMRTGIYPPELRSTNLDIDWFYRRLLPSVWNRWVTSVEGPWQRLLARLRRRGELMWALVYRHHRPEGILARTWPTGSMVLWVVVILAATLIAAHSLRR